MEEECLPRDFTKITLSPDECIFDNKRVPLNKLSAYRFESLYLIDVSLARRLRGWILDVNGIDYIEQGSSRATHYVCKFTPENLHTKELWQPTASFTQALECLDALTNTPSSLAGSEQFFRTAVFYSIDPFYVTLYSNEASTVFFRSQHDPIVRRNTLRILCCGILSCYHILVTAKKTATAARFTAPPCFFEHLHDDCIMTAGERAQINPQRRAEAYDRFSAWFNFVPAPYSSQLRLTAVPDTTKKVLIEDAPPRNKRSASPEAESRKRSQKD